MASRVCRSECGDPLKLCMSITIITISAALKMRPVSRTLDKDWNGTRISDFSFSVTSTVVLLLLLSVAVIVVLVVVVVVFLSSFSFLGGWGVEGDWSVSVFVAVSLVGWSNLLGGVSSVSCPLPSGNK